MDLRAGGRWTAAAGQGSVEWWTAVSANRRGRKEREEVRRVLVYKKLKRTGTGSGTRSHWDSYR